jgi:uncharacterized protein YndB with AHSA1/START domain
MASLETEGRTLVIKREFRGSPDELYDAWTKPDLLVEWWGPEGVTTPEHMLDVRVGGAWTTTMLAPDGERLVVSGVYQVLDRPRRIAFTWAWRQPDGSRGHETVVDVSLEPVARGTRLTLTQKTFAEVGHRDRHDQGWSSSFNKLEKLFA